MKNEIVKLGLILCIITAVASGLLSVVNMVTAPAIAAGIEKANNEARTKILPMAEDFEKVEGELPEGILEVYKGIKGSDIVGYTVKTAPKGYGGPVEVITGIAAEGMVTGVSIGTMNETPGLGAKAKDDAFISQYQDKTADQEINVIKSGQPGATDIVAISGATISSKAVTSGVNDSLKYYNENLK